MTITGPTRKPGLQAAAPAGLALLAVLAASSEAARAQDASQGAAQGAAQAGTVPQTGNGYGAGFGGNTGLGSGAGIAPASGLDARLPSFGGYIQPQPKSPNERAWLFTPAVDMLGGYTSNAAGSSSGSSTPSGLFIITPSLGVNGQTSRLQVNLNYAPTAYLYTSQPSQNNFYQYFNGSAAAALVPETLYLNMRGFVTQQFANGSPGSPSALQVYNRQNTVPVYSVSASPYLTHRFGDFGTGTVGYVATQAFQGSGGILYPQQLFPQALTSTNQYLFQQTEFATFNTGNYFGRLNNRFGITGIQYAGSGTLRDAYDYEGAWDAQYAITRRFSLLGRIGYEDVRYSTIPITHIQDVIWSGGLKYEPHDGSQITISYGHHDGFNSLAVNATYQPTARTQIIAQYGGGLTTGLQTLASFSNATLVDDNGNSVDIVTGAPVQYTSFGSGFNNSTLYQTKQGTLTGLVTFTRDNFSASVTGQQQTPVNAGPFIASNRSIYASVSWSHELSETLRLNAYAQYGSTNYSASAAGPATTRPNVGANVAIVKTLSETLSAQASYNYSNLGVSQSGVGASQTQPGSTVNQFLVGLHKSF